MLREPRLEMRWSLLPPPPPLLPLPLPPLLLLLGGGPTWALCPCGRLFRALSRPQRITVGRDGSSGLDPASTLT